MDCAQHELGGMGLVFQVDNNVYSRQLLRGPAERVEHGDDGGGGTRVVLRCQVHHAGNQSIDKSIVLWLAQATVSHRNIIVLSILHNIVAVRYCRQSETAILLFHFLCN